MDVSLSCAWCFADEASEASWALLSRLQTVEAHVPSLWLWETANVLLQAEQGDLITAAAIRTVLGLLEALPILIDPAGTATIWHDTLALARAHRLTSSDAADLELALLSGSSPGQPRSGPAGRSHNRKRAAAAHRMAKRAHPAPSVSPPLTLNPALLDRVAVPARSSSSRSGPSAAAAGWRW